MTDAPGWADTAGPDESITVELTAPRGAMSHLASVAYVERGEAAVAAGDSAAAAGYFDTALAIRRRLVVVTPDPARRHDLACAHILSGDLAMATGDAEAAEEHFWTALLIARTVLATDDADLRARRDLGIAQQRLGTLHLDAGDTARAGDMLRRAAVGAAELAEAADGGQARRDLAVCHEKLGDLALALGDSAAAGVHYRDQLAALLLCPRSRRPTWPCSASWPSATSGWASGHWSPATPTTPTGTSATDWRSPAERPTPTPTTRRPPGRCGSATARSATWRWAPATLPPPPRSTGPGSISSATPP
jgi:tetratricopeptide (TPR) repeat protein